MRLMTLTEVQARLVDMAPQEISNKTGLSYMTVVNLRKRKHQPTYNTMEQITKYFEARDAEIERARGVSA